MSFRILNEYERKNFHKLFIQEQSERSSDSDNYDQNDENMQKRTLALQILFNAGIGLSTLLLWLAVNAH